MPDTKHAEDRIKNPGGTPGGAWEFLIGLAMAASGGYMLTSRVQVTTGYWNYWWPNSFGLTLIPILAGIGILFFNGRSRIGWLLTWVGAFIVLAGIILNMNIHMGRTSLFETLMMLGLLFGGIGLVARGLKAHS